MTFIWSWKEGTVGGECRLCRSDLTLCHDDDTLQRGDNEMRNDLHLVVERRHSRRRVSSVSF